MTGARFVQAPVMLPSDMFSQLLGTPLSPTDLVLTPNLIAVALTSRAEPLRARSVVSSPIAFTVATARSC